ncbi:hypothetical protein Q9233_016095 [Columba guinea]|nr:hypothetical protein Q9233_016095 [Columba guinea]
MTDTKHSYAINYYVSIEKSVFKHTESQECLIQDACGKGHIEFLLLLSTPITPHPHKDGEFLKGGAASALHSNLIVLLGKALKKWGKASTVTTNTRGHVELAVSPKGRVDQASHDRDKGRNECGFCYHPYPSRCCLQIPLHLASSGEASVQAQCHDRVAQGCNVGSETSSTGMDMAAKPTHQQEDTRLSPCLTLDNKIYQTMIQSMVTRAIDQRSTGFALPAD